MTAEEILRAVADEAEDRHPGGDEWHECRDRMVFGAEAFLDCEPPPNPETDDLDDEATVMSRGWMRATDLLRGWTLASKLAEEHDHPSAEAWARREVTEELPLSRGAGGLRYAQTFRWRPPAPPDAADTPERACLWIAMHHLYGSGLRWKVRRELGRTQEELADDVDRELGTVHGEGWNDDDPTPSPFYYHAEGTAAEDTSPHNRTRPRVEVSRRVEEGQRKQVKLYTGEELIEEVRLLFGIPDPSGATHSAQQSLL